MLIIGKGKITFKYFDQNKPEKLRNSRESYLKYKPNLHKNNTLFYMSNNNFVSVPPRTDLVFFW